MMRKAQLQPLLLDFDLLGIIKKWIQPLDNGSLPNLSLRSKMLNMCLSMPIYKEHLKRSGFGKVIMNLWKHPDETMENKELCRQMIDRWSRNVFSKTLDYSKLAELEAEKREANGGYYRQTEKRPSNRAESVRSQGFMNKRANTSEETEASSRVRIPQSMRLDFSLRPQPKVDMKNLQSHKLDPESKKAKLLKRMQESPALAVIFHSLVSRYRTKDISLVLWFIFVFLTSEVGFPYVWSVVGNFFLVLLLQYIIQAKRPIDYNPNLLVFECTDPDTMGFPSIDSHMAVVVTAPIFFIDSASILTMMIFLICVLLIGMTRVFVGVRFPSQILASWATGIAGVCTANMMHRYLQTCKLPSYYNRVSLAVVVLSVLFWIALWIERSECRVVGVPRAEFTRVIGGILQGDSTNGDTGVQMKKIDARKRDSFYFLMKTMQERHRTNTRRDA
ncbi:hypothetical protein THRCLA_09247, partial [Thraustotheca clavata]